ncbi:D-glycero-D-manno-heptose 1,7-bisphosphate phosphatase; Histidinol-phosphatase [hydrothermal vent metagenome]|uniref:D,D-heptose 1,7-bisphosphate phosphatase n=1 Tax=hydrothermal vent metagenome TaxID=652676 RepID=A0A3B1B4M5_9ZZZZ
MKLVILDRDGVINQDSDDYIKSVDEFIPYPDSLDAIARLNQAGYRVTIATNQSGIGRGYYDEKTLKAMHEKLAQQLAPRGGHIDYIVWCPHRPDQDCDCRKPRPGLLQQIGQHFDTPLNKVVMVGDKPADIEAARAAGARPVLVKTGKGERTLAQGTNLEGVPIYANLSAFVDNFLNQDA